MAGSVNKVILVGNLGKDPESQSFNNGGRAVKFSIATSESWKDKQSGERKEKTEWHNVVIFNDGLGEIAEKYLRKGSKVYLEGALQTRKWQDNSGQDKYSTEVVLARFQGALTLLDKADHSESSAQSGGGRSAPPKQAASFADDLDDDCPFISRDPAYEGRVR